MGEENADLAIVQCTIDLGRNLGLDVVAEGVETREVWERLRALGCKLAQGHYLSRPVPPEQLSAWFRERRSRLSIAASAARGCGGGSGQTDALTTPGIAFS